MRRPSPPRLPPAGLCRAGLFSAGLFSAGLFSAAACLAVPLGLAAAAAVPGCAAVDLTALNPLADDEERTVDADWDEIGAEGRTLDVPLVGGYTSVTGRNSFTIQAVGLVSGLRGTGGDPAPSAYRSELINAMQKRGVENPNQLLARPDTALVLVSGRLPPLIKEGDPFDVEVSIPDGSGATDLTGGWLLPCSLAEAAVVQGDLKSGSPKGVARGPILTITGGDQNARTAMLKRGRILGGGVSKIDRTLTLNMHHRYASGRLVERVTGAIGRRFHGFDEYGIQKPLATAKTNVRIELDILPVYKENYPRYLRVVDSIPVKDTPVLRRLRMDDLTRELNDPPTAEMAAVRLEAIGEDAVPVLLDGLTHGSLEVRFHAATALAYLGAFDGLDTLLEAAEAEPAFRVFAYGAIAAVGGPQAAAGLARLMESESAETRYGAFRALWTIDPNHAALGGEPMRHEDDDTVLFTLYAVPGGPPLVHVTHRRRAEVVVFGAPQQFRIPLALRAGRLLVTCPPGRDRVKVSLGRRNVREVAPDVAAVIRACVELGAAYPDVADMLRQADRQHNLPGGLAIDALPQSGRVYYRPGPDGSAGRKTTVGNAGLIPNLFDAGDDDTPSRREPEDEPEREDDGAGRGDAAEGDTADAGAPPPVRSAALDPVPNTADIAADVAAGGGEPAGGERGSLLDRLPRVSLPSFGSNPFAGDAPLTEDGWEPELE